MTPAICLKVARIGARSKQTTRAYGITAVQKLSFHHQGGAEARKDVISTREFTSVALFQNKNKKTRFLGCLRSEIRF